MTTAWIAGADSAPPTTAPVAPKTAAPVAAAPVYSVGTGSCAGCGGCASCGCDTGCESEGFLSKLKGLFHRGGDCGCGCETSCGCGCDSYTSRFKGFGHHSDCGCGCDTGCGCESEGFLSKLKARFHRGSDCGCGCETSCCGGCGGVISTVPGATTMPRAEPIGPPKEELKKLPSGDGKKAGSVQLIPQPLSTPVLQSAPTTGRSPF